MEYQAFTEGVRPGSVTTSHEIIILVCYILGQVGEPVTLEELSTALQKEELVNYFELMNAVEYLVKAGHVIQRENGRYQLAPLGQKTAATFEDKLPAAVKERGTKALKSVLTLLKRQQENRVEIVKTQDGFQLTLTITDIGTDLLSLRIFMPTLKECEIIRRRFLNDPTIIYKGVFALLTGDLKTVGDLVPSSGEDLFKE